LALWKITEWIHSQLARNCGHEFSKIFNPTWVHNSYQLNLNAKALAISWKADIGWLTTNFTLLFPRPWVTTYGLFYRNGWSPEVCSWGCECTKITKGHAFRNPFNIPIWYTSSSITFQNIFSAYAKSKA
jgi:hypothetical protein